VLVGLRYAIPIVPVTPVNRPESRYTELTKKKLASKLLGGFAEDLDLLNRFSFPLLDMIQIPAQLQVQPEIARHPKKLRQAQRSNGSQKHPNLFTGD
jgi:hypothetical protein